MNDKKDISIISNMKYISIYEISSKIDIEHNTQYK